MTLLDIHMIKTPGWEKNFQKQKALLENDFVKVHEVDFIKDHVFYARVNGFNEGQADYVSYFDDDDRVLDTSWIPSAIQLMDDNPHIAVVYPRYQATRNEQVIHVSPDQPYTLNDSWPRIHSLSIFRRSHMLNMCEIVMNQVAALNPKKTSRLENLLFQSMAMFGTFVHVPNIAYSWDLREGTARSTRLENHVELWAKDFKKRLHANLG